MANQAAGFTMLPLNLGYLLTFFFVLTTLFSVCGLTYVIYNIYFHPLSSYPGPKSFAATRLALARSRLAGRLPYDIKRLHDKYGDVVRIAPDELSYNSADAWKDIYGTRPGHPEMPKDKKFYVNGAEAPGDILVANEADHSRYRRLLSQAFSDKALRDQEPLITTYIDLLIKGLHKRIDSGRPIVDLVSWYNWTTFDVIGDLAVGAPFNCLSEEGYHFWVSMIFDNVKATSIFNEAQRYPGVVPLMQLFTPKRLKEAIENHSNLTVNRVEARMALQTDRADFMSHIQKQQNEKGMSKEEIFGVLTLLMIAGSETTASLLSGATYYLLKNPRVMEKLVAEVRGKFTSEDQLNLAGVNSLDYMLAVLDEGLRMYPPSPTGLPRVVPAAGDTICGKWVPGGTAVSVSQWAANRSSANFTLPESFIPERFLGDPRFSSDKRSAFQPFSFGPRNCVGRSLAYAEMRLILARIIWNFDLKLADDSQKWNEQHIFTFWEKRPLNVILSPAVRG